MLSRTKVTLSSCLLHGQNANPRDFCPGWKSRFKVFNVRARAGSNGSVSEARRYMGRACQLSSRFRCLLIGSRSDSDGSTDSGAGAAGSAETAAGCSAESAAASTAMDSATSGTEDASTLRRLTGNSCNERLCRGSIHRTCLGHSAAGDSAARQPLPHPTHSARMIGSRRSLKSR